MNQHGKKQYKKNIKWLISLCLMSCLIICVGCGEKDPKQSLAEDFIRTQINCNTYTGAGEDTEVLKLVFLEYFTEESYQKYLDDTFGYLYPQLFYFTKASKSQIKKIKCTNISSEIDGITTYDLEVEYILTELDEDKKKTLNKLKMKDYLKISINSENKIEQVVILNTSDIIQKLFLDIQVQ